MERSYGFPSNYFQNKHLLIPHLGDLYYKGLPNKSKGMLKTPEFHASYDTIGTESKDMLKLQNFRQHMTL
jgi:hypothetical protein